MSWFRFGPTRLDISGRKGEKQENECKRGRTVGAAVSGIKLVLVRCSYR